MADTLAQLSNLLLVVAIAIYAVAFLGFAIDLAGSAQRRSDARLAARTGEGAAAATDAAASKLTALERAGGGAGAFAMVMASLAAALHLGGVVLRGVATGRVPWSNMYEFAMTGSVVVMIVFLLIVSRRRDMRVLGTFLVGPALILMLIAQRLWYIPAAHLPPSLQNSHWLVIHVLVAIIASAMFTIGAVVSVLQLIQARREARAPRVDGTADATAAPSRVRRLGTAIMDRLPSAADLEAFAFRLHAVGFVLWTFTLIFGSIWAASAWGRYWGWDPKEVWTFVIWVVYAAYLHARATVGFRGSRAAWFALAGFACVIFNFTIVNTVINGLHSYSGLT